MAPHLTETTDGFLFVEVVNLFSKFRFITVVTTAVTLAAVPFAVTPGAFAQELPAPAAPEKTKEAPQEKPAKPRRKKRM